MLKDKTEPCIQYIVHVTGLKPTTYVYFGFQLGTEVLLKLLSWFLKYLNSSQVLEYLATSLLVGHQGYSILPPNYFPEQLLNTDKKSLV